MKGYVGSEEKLRQYFTEYFVSKAHSFRALFSGDLERYIPVQKAPLFGCFLHLEGNIGSLFVKEDRMCRLKTGMGLRFFTLKFNIGFCTYHSLLGDCGIFFRHISTSFTKIPECSSKNTASKNKDIILQNY